MRISNLKSKRSQILGDAQALLLQGLNSPETKEKYSSLLVDADNLESEIRDLERVDEFFQKNPSARPLAEPAPVVPVPTIVAHRDSREHRDKVNAAAQMLFRKGPSALNEESRALLTVSDAAGGALVSQLFDDAFIEASKFYGPIFDLVHRKDSPNGAPAKFVVTDGTNQTFSLLTQGTTSASSAAHTPTVFSNITDTDTLISSVVYSAQEVDDAFDLMEFLNRILGLAVSRARETAVTLGTTNDGTSTVLPHAAGGFLASVGAGVTQTAGQLAAGPTYSQLSALSASVDRAYFQVGSFMSSPSVEAFLRAQVTTTGSPLYPVDSEGYLVINGKRLWPNAAMPSIGTPSSPLVCFGDYRRFWNVQNGGVRLKVVNRDENPALTLLTRELIVWTRLGQSAGLSNSVKSLVTAAS